MTSYSTTFPGTQAKLASPFTTGIDPFQSAVQCTPGLVFGTQTGDEWQQVPPLFNDSQAFLQAFPSDHRAELTIHKAGVPVGDLEVEILLGMSVGALRHPHFGDTHTDGIEINLTLGEFGILCFVARYLELEVANFSSTASAFGINNGDILAAQLTLNTGTSMGTVTVSMIRGGVETVFGSVTDAALFRVGNPGLAFFRQNNGTPDDPTLFCGSAFSAWSLPASVSAGTSRFSCTTA
jgi:hypothetical protein